MDPKSTMRVEIMFDPKSRELKLKGPSPSHTEFILRQALLQHRKSKPRPALMKPGPQAEREIAAQRAAIERGYRKFMR